MINTHKNIIGLLPPEKMIASNLKILFVHCTYQYRGGECNVVDDEMELLRSAGVKVKLLSFTNHEGEFYKLMRLPFNSSSYKKALETIDSFKPDVVHVHNLHFAASPSVLYAIKKRQVPMVVTLHNYRLLCPSGTLFLNGKLFLSSLKQHFKWSAVINGAYKNSKPLTLWMAVNMQLHQWAGTWQIPDKIIVLTEHARSLFEQSKLKLKPHQLVVKPNFSVAPPQDRVVRRNHFLFIGRLSNEKGIDILLSTFSSNGYPLKIAGDGPAKEKVISFAEKFFNIEYLGSLNKTAVYQQMQSCTALIFPSTWYEGMPLTIIESFACGTPVIASRLGAMASMVTDGHNGIHFDVNDNEGLAKAAEHWNSLSQPEKKWYEKNALETYAEYYTPQKNLHDLIGIYKSEIRKRELV